MNVLVPRTSALSKAFPAILQRAGTAACLAADEFFSARISNSHNPPRLCPPRGAYFGENGHLFRRQSGHLSERSDAGWVRMGVAAFFRQVFCRFLCFAWSGCAILTGFRVFGFHSFLVLFFLMESPFKSMVKALCTRRSRIASPTVGSPLNSCQLFTGY